jgi:DegV family protein with EDD domain
MSSVKIIADSIADLDPQWLEQYDIRIVPAFVNFGDESFPDDGVSLTREEFYARLEQAGELPTTSAPPPGIAEAAFEDALSTADHVIALTVSADLSSINESLTLAARNVAPERITVIDSGTISMGIGWQVLAGAEAAAAGKPVDEVKAIIESTRRRTRVYALIDTMDNLRRSGRISWLVASIGALLQIKPILQVIDSEVSVVSRARTFKRGLPEIVQLTQAEAPLERLAVMHANAPDRGASLRDLVTDVAPPDYTWFTDIATAISTHIGVGAVGVATVRRQ